MAANDNCQPTSNNWVGWISSRTMAASDSEFSGFGRRRRRMDAQKVHTMTMARRIGGWGGTMSSKNDGRDKTDDGAGGLPEPHESSEPPHDGDENAQVHPGEADQVEQARPPEGLVGVRIDVPPLAEQQGFEDRLAPGVRRRMIQQASRRRIGERPPQVRQEASRLIEHRDGLPRGHRRAHVHVLEAEVLGDVELARIRRLLVSMEPAIGLDGIADLEIGGRLVHADANRALDRRLAVGGFHGLHP